MIFPAICLATAAVAAAGHATFLPRSRIWGDVISRGATNTNRVALTFDDGPTPRATDRILDILHELKVPGTFFVIGANARRHPDLLRRIHDEGHLLGNHSYHHAHYAMFRGPRYWAEELDRTSDLITAATGNPTTIFRPPMGIKTPIILSQARRRQLRTIAWTHRGHDGFPTTPQKIARRLTTNVRPGSILMIHDGIEPNHPRDPEPSVQSVRPVVQRIREMGIDFCRLDEMV